MIISDSIFNPPLGTSDNTYQMLTHGLLFLNFLESHQYEYELILTINHNLYSQLYQSHLVHIAKTKLSLKCLVVSGSYLNNHCSILFFAAWAIYVFDDLDFLGQSLIFSSWTLSLLSSNLIIEV